MRFERIAISNEKECKHSGRMDICLFFYILSLCFAGSAVASGRNYVDRK